MLYEVLEGIVGGISFALIILIIVESSRSISEKKRRQKMGLTDYYDQPIKKDKEDKH